MKTLNHHTGVLLFFVFITGSMVAQSGNGLKGKKRSNQKEIIKRQQEAQAREAEDTPFGVTSKSGRNAAEMRDDLMWRAESGKTIYEHAGNLSIIEPSRYGLKDDLELESYLGVARWVPNIFVKKQWLTGKWNVATRHGFYTATPGYQYFQSRDDTIFAKPADEIPFILSTKQQLIVSRAYYDFMGCRGSQPFLILSAGIGIDAGYPFGLNDLIETNKHFLANRSRALAGLGYAAHLFVRGDLQLGPAWVLSGSLKYFRGDFIGKNAFEQQFTAEAFVTDNLSMTFGFALSEAGYNTSSSIGIAPIVDVCWYFGVKKSRQMGLFNQNSKLIEYKTHKNKKLNRDTNRDRFGK
jgi:hypothetical protein